MSPDEAIKHLEVHFDSQSIGPANTICIDREAIGLALERMRRLRELEADRAQRAALWECPTCAEEHGYQRGLAERDAELATAKARIVALGVEGDEMDQKHLDELRERDDRLRELREEALTAAMLLRDEGWTIAAERLELAASAPVGEQEKSDVGREDHSSAPNSTSPPAEAPQESGTENDAGATYTGKTPGTLRGEYERMAREWYRERVCDEDDCIDLRAAPLTALLARVADERQRKIVEWLRAGRHVAHNCDEDYANAIASNVWRAKP